MSHIKHLKIHWSLILAIIVLSLQFVTQYQIVRDANDGHFVYSLDDAYIHMALGRSLATHGVWGVTVHEMSSTSSSLLYTTLLGLSYALFGVNEIMPLILNFLTIVALMTIVYVTLRTSQAHPVIIPFVLLSIIFVFPTIRMAFGGMEHLLHGVLVVLVILQTINVLNAPEKLAWNTPTAVRLYIATFLVATVRYEGLFMVGVIYILLLLQRRFRIAILMLLCAVLPVLIYGLFSLAHGGFFLPNSVYLKGRVAVALSIERYAAGFNLIHLGEELSLQSKFVMPLIMCLSLALVAAHRSQKLAFWRETAALGLWLGGTILYFALVDKGGRYSDFVWIAALAPLTLFSARAFPNTLNFKQMFSLQAGLLGLLLLMMLLVTAPFVTSTTATLRDTFANHQIYLQQYQMAKFLQRYYPDASVAANDIGAITFFTNIELVDLIGLGNNPIAHDWVERGGVDMRQLTREADTDVIMIYDIWFEKQIPAEWVKVATWEIPEEGVVGSPVVSFYAPTPDAAETLAANLIDFQPSLPPEVTVVYYYEP